VNIALAIQLLGMSSAHDPFLSGLRAFNSSATSQLLQIIIMAYAYFRAPEMDYCYLFNTRLTFS